MKDKPFDPTKPARAKDDELYEVRIFCADGGGEWPIMGAQRLKKESAGRWLPTSWTLEGYEYCRSAPSPRDLVNIPEKRRVHYWQNFYRSADGEEIRDCSFMHPSKEKAKKYRQSNCFACIEIDREVEEGEGL